MTQTTEEQIKEILEYCLEHNHVGHELDADLPSCAWLTSKGKKKCNCPWGSYEKMLTEKIQSLLLLQQQTLQRSLVEEVVSGLSALELYTQHEHDAECVITNYPDDPEEQCTCGLDDLIRLSDGIKQLITKWKQRLEDK